MKKRGFITIATGKEEYYIIAANLLKTYRYFCNEPLPFAILCDRENEYTKDFDDVILFKDGATNSYLDKLALMEYIPYEETVFIDADCLAYGDLNSTFDYFNDADDFCCFGRVLPLDDTTGWFRYENLGELKSQVSYVVGLHGGIYYMRKTEKAAEVLRRAKELIPDYTKYQFGGKFATPGDEPLVALSMALNDCKPIPFDLSAILCYWEYLNNMNLDITEGRAEVINPEGYTKLLHWGTRYTRELEYKEQMELFELMCSGREVLSEAKKLCRNKYAKLIKQRERDIFKNRVKNKIKRTLHI